MATLDPRFIYLVSRKNRKTMKFETHSALNADGHIDYAHQLGLKDITTKVLESQLVKEEDGGYTHWVTVQATIEVNGRIANGMATTNSRNVTTPGFETAVAETRAIKRAIAVACNITEKLINPDGKTPTREFVDLPREEPPEPEIPGHLRKSPDDVSGSDQFEL